MKRLFVKQIKEYTVLVEDDYEHNTNTILDTHEVENECRDDISVIKVETDVE